MFRQYRRIFDSPGINLHPRERVVTSNDSRDIMNGPSAEATRSRDLFWDFRCKLHAQAPLSLPVSGGDGYLN